MKLRGFMLVYDLFCSFPLILVQIYAIMGSFTHYWADQSQEERVDAQNSTTESNTAPCGGTWPGDSNGA
jgi:hypothetical protein